MTGNAMEKSKKLIPSMLAVLLSAALIGGSVVFFLYFNSHICGSYRTARFWIFIAAILVLMALGFVAGFWIFETEGSDRSLPDVFAVGVVVGPALCIAGDVCVFFVSKWFWIMTGAGTVVCATTLLFDNHREFAAYVNAIGLATAFSLVVFWFIFPIYDDWRVGAWARAARIYNHVDGIYYSALKDNPDELAVTGYHERALKTLRIPNEAEGKAVVGIVACRFRCECGLERVEIPYTVRIIQSDAFAPSDRLVDAAYTGSATQWCAIEFGNEFANPLCYAQRFYTDDGLLTEAVLDDGLQRISAYAFCGYGGLTAVFIPDTATEIGAYAFGGCDGLAEIEFGGTLAEWANVTKGENWAHGVSAEMVKCSDGTARLLAQ